MVVRIDVKVENATPRRSDRIDDPVDRRTVSSFTDVGDALDHERPSAAPPAVNREIVADAASSPSTKALTPA